MLEFFTVQINNDNPRSATQVRPFHVGAFIAQLEAKGIKPTVSITEARPGFTIAMVTDPDGNTVQFLQNTSSNEPACKRCTLRGRSPVIQS